MARSKTSKNLRKSTTGSKSSGARATKKAPAKKAPASAAKARASYQALMREVEDAELDTQRGWDRLWEAAREVVRKRYFLFEEDTPTAAAWVLKHTGELYRTAQRNMTVAALSSPDEQRLYKVTRIGLAYAIDDATRAAEAKKKKVDYTTPETPEKLDLASLRYRVERDGERLSVGLAEASADELRAVLRSLRRRAAREDSRLGPTASKLVGKLAKDRSLDNVRVIERDGELSLSGVRADQLGPLGALLVALSRE